MDILALAIFGMATWRLSSMLVRETGPWDLFVRIRRMAGIQHDENKVPYMVPDNTLAGILSCTWCASMWVGMFWMGLFLITPLLAVKIAAVFAISTGAILVDKWVGN